MSEQTKLKTRCYYTEYVNHMVRFYLSCPDNLMLEGKRRCDVENWIAVQGVLHGLSDGDRDKITQVYKTHYNLPTAVSDYCAKTGANERAIWVLLTKVSSQIAKRRGLV